MSAKNHSPNDQRGIVKNPNNPAYAADRANREHQRHGNNTPPAQQPGKPAPK